MSSVLCTTGVDRACLLPKCGSGDTVCNDENALQSNNMDMVNAIKSPKWYIDYLIQGYDQLTKGKRASHKMPSASIAVIPD